MPKTARRRTKVRRKSAKKRAATKRRKNVATKRRAKKTKKAASGKRRRRKRYKRTAAPSAAQREVQRRFKEPQLLSAPLEAVVGKGPLPRTEVTKKLWRYIKYHNLQNPHNRREIRPDSTLGKVIGNRPIDMFQMTKAVNSHIGRGGTHGSAPAQSCLIM